jgi:hypothetical protein
MQWRSHSMLDGRFYSVGCKTGPEAFPETGRATSPLAGRMSQMRDTSARRDSYQRMLTISAVFPVFSIGMVTANGSMKSTDYHNDHRDSGYKTHHTHTLHVACLSDQGSALI